jgi:DNA gyrase/topoisomerase IV subunit A
MFKLKQRVELLEKCDNYNTMYQEQADKRIKELEENLRLVYEYLGVHKEVINDTLLVEDDYKCDCDEYDEEDDEDKDILLLHKDGFVNRISLKDNNIIDCATYPEDFDGDITVATNKGRFISVPFRGIPKLPNSKGVRIIKLNKDEEVIMGIEEVNDCKEDDGEDWKTIYKKKK